MGKGDRKTKKGKRSRGSYGKSRLQNKRKSNFIKLENLRKWSKERLYAEIGKYDFTVSIIFKKNTFSFQNYGQLITGALYFTINERKQLDIKINSGIKTETDGNILFTTFLREKLTKDQIKKLKVIGFESNDICSLDYYAYKRNPTYLKKKNKKIEEPLKINMNVRKVTSKF